MYSWHTCCRLRVRSHSVRPRLKSLNSAPVAGQFAHASHPTTPAFPETSLNYQTWPTSLCHCTPIFNHLNHSQPWQHPQSLLTSPPSVRLPSSFPTSGQITPISVDGALPVVDPISMFTPKCQDMPKNAKGCPCAVYDVVHVSWTFSPHTLGSLI